MQLRRVRSTRQADDESRMIALTCEGPSTVRGGVTLEESRLAQTERVPMAVSVISCHDP